MNKVFTWLKNLSKAEQVVLGVVVLALVGTASASTNQNPSGNPAPGTSQTQHTPKVEVKTETETQSTPFTSSTIENGTMAKGTTKITTTGANGSNTLIYQVTYKDGKQTDKKLVKTDVTLAPVTQVTSIGTYVAPTPQPKQASSSCDSNYSGACVPIASDVDCAGGSGNGPAYVSGPVRVVGSDIYGLDRDGDGVGCE